MEHLENSTPSTVSGDKLSIYSIALEGWRRGLNLKFFTIKRRQKHLIKYSLSDTEKEITFSYSTGPNVTAEAMNITSSKTKTKEYLNNVGVPVPKGKNYMKHANEEIITDVSRSLIFPVVLKPASGKMGKGVIANIKTAEELKTSLLHVREYLGFKGVIVEEYIPGEEYRIYVIDGKIIAAMNRLPANITGDGERSIRKLIIEKNKQRKQIPSVRARPIKIDAEVTRNIEAYEYTIDSIPAIGEKLLLRKNSNISSGGDPVDVTDLLNEQVKDVAVKAAKAVPGLVETGVDLIVDNRDNSGKVIELNTKVGLGGHLFPLEGKARDIPKAIIDYYFPNSKRITTDLYFNYTKVTGLLKNGVLQEVTLPSIPNEEVIVKSIIVKGKVQKVGFRNFIRIKALYCNVNGFVKNDSDGSVFIVVAGTREKIANFEELLRTKYPKRVNIDSIEESVWNGPVEYGFEIIADSKNTKKK